MIRLIALDLDGTLLDPAGRITQASKDAIARARAAGVRVVLNTGRPIQEAVWFAGEAGCDALLSCLGGAAVVDGVRGETLRRWDMPEESGRRALELCLGREIELMIFAGEEIVVDPFSKESLSRTYPFPIFHSAAVVAEDPRAYLEERGLPLTKVHGDWNQARYPLEELGALPGVPPMTTTWNGGPPGWTRGGPWPCSRWWTASPGGRPPPWGTATTTCLCSGRRGCPSPWAMPRQRCGRRPSGPPPPTRRRE